MPIPYEEVRPISRLWGTFSAEPCHVPVVEPVRVPSEIQRLQELLFEHSGALPEGAYLEAMDCLMAIAGRI